MLIVTHFSFMDTHSLKVKRWEKISLYKWKAEETKIGYTFIRPKKNPQTVTEIKGHSLYNDKGINSSRYNN